MPEQSMIIPRRTTFAPALTVAGLRVGDSFVGSASAETHCARRRGRRLNPYGCELRHGLDKSTGSSGIEMQRPGDFDTNRIHAAATLPPSPIQCGERSGPVAGGRLQTSSRRCRPESDK
jgi:hypothetical protein